MVALEEKELVEVRKALELRKRTSGVGTDPHETCKRVLSKLFNSETELQESVKRAKAQADGEGI